MTDPATTEPVPSPDPAVLFIIFNRLDTAREVMRAIASQRPRRLYIAGDGPRTTRPGEDATTREVRDAVSAMIDWPCEVHTLFQDRNLGCRQGVKTAIDWFFTNEAEGIILEDDVIPSPDFFRFCAEMLERYRDDPRVMMVSGTNPLGAGIASSRYFFSSLGSIWGWASWRDAWSRYDVDMKGWGDPELLKTLRTRHGRATARYLRHTYDFHRKHDIDTWDTQWSYTMQRDGGVSVLSEANLIRNIGILGTHSSVETRNHNLAHGLVLWPVTQRTLTIGEDVAFRRRVTKEILTPAMLISTLSQLSRRLRVHGLMTALYGVLTQMRSKRDA